MTWIKICGMTNLEDALVAVEAGADAVGFVFYEKSPRKIDAETVREIVAKLPKNTEKVGVFVGGPAERVNELAARTGVTSVQFYGSDGKPRSADWLGISRENGRKLIVAISGADLNNGGVLIGNQAKQHIDSLLIDSGSGGRLGGTGLAFNWRDYRGQVGGLNRTLPVIVAGGLTPENVGEAIGILKPWGVDVASGVESSPGKKDPKKVRAFVRAVRAADKLA